MLDDFLFFPYGGECLGFSGGGLGGGELEREVEAFAVATPLFASSFSSLPEAPVIPVDASRQRQCSRTVAPAMMGRLW